MTALSEKLLPETEEITGPDPVPPAEPPAPVLAVRDVRIGDLAA